MSAVMFYVDPEVMSGSMCIHGTRIPVMTVRRFIDDGYTNKQIKQEYPTLDLEEIQAVRNWNGH